MRGIELHSPDGRYSVYLSAGGRRLVMAAGQCGEDAPGLPSMEATGLRCRACYRNLTDAPALLQLLADRLKRKRLHASYHRRYLARRRRSRR